MSATIQIVLSQIRELERDIEALLKARNKDSNEPIRSAIDREIDLLNRQHKYFLGLLQRLQAKYTGYTNTVSLGLS